MTKKVASKSKSKTKKTASKAGKKASSSSIRSASKPLTTGASRGARSRKSKGSAARSSAKKSVKSRAHSAARSKARMPRKSAVRSSSLKASTTNHKAVSFESLFIKELQGLYDVEQHLVKLFPQVIQAANSAELKQALQNHADETKEHVKRLDQIFKSLGHPHRGTGCSAIQGLVQDIHAVLKIGQHSPLRDAALIAAIQCIEHYEVACYGTARTFARHIGKNDAAALLQKTLDEEGKADKLLTSIAEGGLFSRGINKEALVAGSAKRRR